jgi:hypothetical protein
MNQPSPLVLPPSTSTIARHPTLPSSNLLAAALTRLVLEKYQRILPIEYIGYVCELPLYCPNLSATISFNQLVFLWVQSRILRKESDEGQKEGQKEGLVSRWHYKSFFVETAMVSYAFGTCYKQS